MNQNTALRLNCGHYFHTKCIVQWGEQDKDTCPLCRVPMDVHSLLVVNKGVMDYIGMLIFSLPTDHRRQLLLDVMHVINHSFDTMHTPPQQALLYAQPQTGQLLHTVLTPMGIMGVFEDRQPATIIPTDPRLDTM